MRVEMIISEPFEEFEIIKGYIPEPIWKAWSGLCSVRFITEGGREHRLPAGIYFRLKLQGEAEIRCFPLRGKLVLASLRVVKE
jgi:hypothetical protein